MFKNTNAFSGFSVNDIAQAKQFYGDLLGIDTEETPMGLKLKFADGMGIFVYPKPNHTPASFTILNFSVDNIDKAVKELAAKGVTFEHYDGMTDDQGIARGLSRNQGPDIAWFKDPAGNILSVLQDK